MEGISTLTGKNDFAKVRTLKKQTNISQKTAAAAWHSGHDASSSSRFAWPSRPSGFCVHLTKNLKIPPNGGILAKSTNNAHG